MNLNMNNYKKPFYYLFPIVGLNIISDDTYNDFLFADTTILNISEFIDNFFSGDEINQHIQYEVGIIHPAVYDFQDSHKTGKKYIPSPNNSFLAIKFFEYDDEKDKILIYRATEIGSLIAFAFLIGSNFEIIVSLSKHVYFTDYSRTKAIDSQGYNIIERTQMIPEAIHFSLPKQPYEFKRADVKRILQTEYINPLFNLIIDKKIYNDYKTRLVDALIFFISSINSPNINLQFLGAMISIERMLKIYDNDNKNFEKYKILKQRTSNLISMEHNIEYKMDELFQSRHDFVHGGILPTKEIVINSIYYASIAIIEYGNLIYNKIHQDVFSYLSNNSHNIDNRNTIFKGWEKHELLS